MNEPPIRAMIVTNIPTPYRMPVYELLHRTPGVHLGVVYLSGREPNRAWVLPPSRVPSTVLRSRYFRVGDRFIHFTSGVWPALRRFRPDVVVTTGFNPPQLVAFLYCVLHRVPHVAQTDGSTSSEAALTALHRLVRRVVAHRSEAFVAASDSGMHLMRSWGAPAGRLFKSPLAVANDAFAVESTPRDIDLLFAGRLTDVKNPVFALEVAQESARRLGRRLVLAFVGDGPLEEHLRERAAAVRTHVDVVFAGFVQQDDLPRWYARAKVFLFPTSWDPWGLVVNEAAAARTPQIVSPHAGSGRELVIDGTSGFVRGLRPEDWAEAVVELLQSPARAGAFAEAGAERVCDYTFQRAADGLLAGLRRALNRVESAPTDPPAPRPRVQRVGASEAVPAPAAPTARSYAATAAKPD